MNIVILGSLVMMFICFFVYEARDQKAREEYGKRLQKGRWPTMDEQMKMKRKTR